MDLPIVCTLTPDELRERRSTIIADLRGSAISAQKLADGYAYAFRADSDTLLKLTRLVDMERQCCQFLTFKIIVAPVQTLRFEVTGPPAALGVIAEYFATE